MTVKEIYIGPEQVTRNYLRHSAWGADGRGHENNYESIFAQRSGVMVEIRWAGGRWLPIHPCDAIRGNLLLGDFPDNRASSKVYAALTQSDFNAGVFAGEFKETVQFITDSVTRVAKSIKAVRRRDFRGAATALFPGRGSSFSKAANEWLTYQYALIPLLLDVKSAYELLTREFVVVKSVRETAKDEPKLKPDPYLGIQFEWEGFSLVQVRAQIRTRVSIADRVGLTDPLSIAWELTKLSFVVDWFLPIGNFLSALNARNKVEFLPGSQMVTRTRSERWHSPKPNGDEMYHWIPEATDESFQKNVYTHRRAFLDLHVTLPTLRNPLGESYERYLTATALLGQAVRSLK